MPRLLEPSGSRAVVWRAMALQFIAAGSVALGGIAWGVDPEVDATAITAMGVMATVAGAVMMPFASRISERLVVPTQVAGLGLVSAAVLGSAEPDSPYLLFYLWISVAAWFFLRAGQAVAMTALTVLVSGVVIAAANDGEADAGTWWLTVSGSVVVVSALAGILHGRAQRVISRLADAVVRDPLTGLLNRRGYQDRLEAELKRADRYRTPLSIVLGDLDSFKALNDRFGHRFGDETLRAFADICRHQLREDVDFVARVGGEEFAFVLPNTSESGAIFAAERMRHAIADRLRAPDGAGVSASFGVAVYPQHGTDPEVLLDHADQAMYAAKALGRNRTMAFGENLPRADQPTGQQEHLQAVILLAETLDLRDAGTRAHSETVSGLSRQIAERLGLPRDRVERIRLAGLLHDIGKLGVPDDVLRKPGPLDPAEWAEMRKHPELGARIVEGAGLQDIAEWVLAHHERPDGAGYPYGLPGDQVPLEARILAVADAYEAMTADRPYRQAMGEQAAREQLERGAGTQFDAAVVNAFIGALRAARRDLSPA